MDSKDREELLRLKRIYRNMVNRCYNKNFPRYVYYGRKGISICEEWRGGDGFFNFYSWAISHGYKNNLQIDRIDTYGNYEPANCRWVDTVCQLNNTSRNCLVFYDDKWQTLSQLAKKYGVDRYVLRNRIFRNWSLDRLFNASVKGGV